MGPRFSVLKEAWVGGVPLLPIFYGKSGVSLEAADRSLGYGLLPQMYRHNWSGADSDFQNLNSLHQAGIKIGSKCEVGSKWAVLKREASGVCWMVTTPYQPLTKDFPPEIITLCLTRSQLRRIEPIPQNQG